MRFEGGTKGEGEGPDGLYVVININTRKIVSREYVYTEGGRLYV